MDLCWLRDASRNKIKSKVFKNQKTQFEELKTWWVKQTQCDPADTVIVIEPTGVYHENVAHYLYREDFRVTVVNPGSAKKFAESIGQTHKTDKADAAMLAHYGQTQHAQNRLTFWQPEPFEVRRLKAMLRRLDALMQDRRREQGRLEASVHAEISQRVLTSIQAMLDALDREMADLVKDIDDHIDGHPELRQCRQLVESVKGIGPVMSRELTCLFVGKQFKNAKQVAAYLGLIPRIIESGKLRGHVSLSKIGPPRLRAKLYMAAVAASTHHPDIRAQQKRLLANGKTRMQALGAAMRKLVQICFGVVKHQQVYQPQAQA